MRRRPLLAVASVLLASVIVIGVEIALALRRQYLGADHVLELDGAFGALGERPLRFVVLGDSTSVGVGARDASEAYPVLLARRLASHTGRRVVLDVVGSSGARADDVAEVQAPRAAELEPDLIFIGIGANDVTHLTSLGAVRDAMRRTLESLERPARASWLRARPTCASLPGTNLCAPSPTSEASRSPER